MSKKYLALLMLATAICVAISPEAIAGPGEGGKLPYETWVRQM